MGAATPGGWTVEGMHAGPSITAELLAQALVDHNVADEAHLISALGEKRHNATLFALEKLLVDQHVLSVQRLLLLKGLVAGLPVLDVTGRAISNRLDQAVARSSGALLVDRDPLTVAFIEDTPANVDRVSRVLETPEFEVWLMTAQQFADNFQATYLDVHTDTRQPLTTIFEIFDEAIDRRASDIHLAVGRPPIIRVDGHLIELLRTPIDQDWMQRELEVIGGHERVTLAHQTSVVDFAYPYGTNRFRCDIGLSIAGLTLAARLLPTKIPTFDTIGLLPAIRNFASLERGLVLVTGPTGSGKSTTLASILSEIARKQDRHIITLEDPVEFILPQDGLSQVDQRELGDSFHSFPDALRQALRQDPDVILVGELRDNETMRTALNAAETGHLVFGTLHTYDSSSSVGRLVSMFGPEEQTQVRSQLAYILKGIVSQTLLPHASGRGRVAAFEVLVGTPGVQNNLRKVDGHHQLRQSLETGRSDGMMTMEMSLADLVRSGRVTFEEAEFKAKDVDDFRRRIEAPEYNDRDMS
jgi:twitching motility protein PilT